MQEAEDKRQLDNLIKNKKFTKAQIGQIEAGIRDHLTDEQIGVFASERFTATQMLFIKRLYTLPNRKFTLKEIELIANPDFSIGQMDMIKWGFNSNLSFEQVKIYASTEFTEDQMNVILAGLQDYIQVEQYADARFDAGQMDEIRIGLKSGLDVSLYKDPDFNINQMFQIRLGLESKLPVEQIKKYANPRLSADDMFEYRKLLEKGVKYPERYFETKKRYKNLPDDTLQALAHTAANSTVSYEKLDVIAKGNFTEEQIKFLISVGKPSDRAIKEQMTTEKNLEKAVKKGRHRGDDKVNR